MFPALPAFSASRVCDLTGHRARLIKGSERRVRLGRRQVYCGRDRLCGAFYPEDTAEPIYFKTEEEGARWLLEGMVRDVMGA